MKSGFWLIQIKEQDRYKITFMVLFDHYKWNVIHFRVKYISFEFKNI